MVRRTESRTGTERCYQRCTLAATFADIFPMEYLRGCGGFLLSCSSRYCSLKVVCFMLWLLT